MGEDKSGKLNENEARKVLGDIGNLVLGKRGYSFISRSPAKSKIRVKQLAKDDDSDSNFLKRVALAVEKLEKVSKMYGLQNPCSDAKKDVSNVSDEMKDVGNSALDSIVLDAGETAKGGCVSGVKVGECSKMKGVGGGKASQGDEIETVVLSNVVEDDGSVGVLGAQIVSDVGRTRSIGVDCVVTSKSESIVNSRLGESLEIQGFGLERCTLLKGDDGSVEVLGTQFASNGGRTRSMGVDCVVTSKSESIVSSRLGESREIQGFGLERCTLLKGDDSSTVAADVEAIKQCSCSFCTQAAFICSDLHYQDMKGRLSVLARSQKEASNLAKKYYNENDTGKLIQGNNVDQLEIDLTSQWRSLFNHLEDVYGNEGNQLQNNFLALKDIRDDFKMNLETIGMPVDALQCSSDVSDCTAS